MFYLVDGYNLIFSLLEPTQNLQVHRHKIIHFLQRHFARKKIAGLLVFDGSHRRDEESGLSYPSPLTVAYAPKGQSADAYICEYLEGAAHPKQTTVVTNDKGLARHARSYGAQVQSNEDFLLWLNKRKKGREKKTARDTPQNLDRLLKIFEEKLNHPQDDM